MDKKDIKKEKIQNQLLFEKLKVNPNYELIRKLQQKLDK
jgi:hypothetical protein